MNSALTYLKSLRSGNRLFDATFILLGLTMLILPFTTWLMWPTGVLLVILWLAQGDWRGKWANFKANDGFPYGLFLLSVCLIPITGLFFSDNMGYAWLTVECYLWFFIAPLIILTTSRKLLTKRHIHFLLALFSISVTVNILVLLTHGIFMAAKTGDSSYLYYEYFSFLRHSSYVAMYTTFAYLIILLYLINNREVISVKRTIALYVTQFILVVGVFCLYSRAGIIVLVIVHIPVAIYAMRKRRTEWKWMLLTVCVVTTLLTLLLTTHILPENRFTDSKYTLEIDETSEKKSEVRPILWQASWEAAVENLPFGTGTGDSFDVIREKYRALGLDRDYNYNAHNQYLQALVTNGIPGIILLLLYFFTPLAESIRYRDILLFSLFILLALNSCFECVFDRRFGVDFFALFIPLLMMRAKAQYPGGLEIPAPPSETE